MLPAVLPSGTGSVDGPVDDRSVDDGSLDPNDAVDNPCAAASVEAKPPVPRWPATG